jgi:hypothetical protein
MLDKPFHELFVNANVRERESVCVCVCVYVLRSGKDAKQHTQTFSLYV